MTTSTVPSDTDRLADIRSRLDAASEKTTMDVHAGRSTLCATVSGGDRGRFIGGMGDLVAATVGETGPLTVTVADDEDGQDATLALHARDDLAFLLGKVEALLAHNGELVKEIYFQAKRADEQKTLAQQLQGRLDTAEGQLATARDALVLQAVGARKHYEFIRGMEGKKPHYTPEATAFAEGSEKDSLLMLQTFLQSTGEVVADDECTEAEAIVEAALGLGEGDGQ
jgi:hypothetical protein